MIGNLFIPGAGLIFSERGAVVGLEEESRVRAELAADIAHGHQALAHDISLSDEAILYFSGAYPRLPKGVVSVAVEEREASLMRSIAVDEKDVPFERTEIEPEATSTIENVLFTLRRLTGAHHPDKRDIERGINPGRRLGVIATLDQMPRISDTFYTMGCPRGSLVEIHTNSSRSISGLGNYALHKLGVAVGRVQEGDTSRLLKVSHALEKGNDARHVLAGGVKKLLGKR